MKKRTRNSRNIINGVLVLMFVQVIGPAITMADPSWTVTQVSNDNVCFVGSPAISGTNVVWVGSDGSHYQIYSNFAGQVSFGTTDAYNPAISGTNVVWQASVGGYSQVFSRFDGQLSDSSTADNEHPAISGANVVWQGYSQPHVTQVYSSYAGQLTNYTHVSGNPYTGAENPALSGTNVAWEQFTGNWATGHSEIYSNFGGPWSGVYTFNLYPAVSGENVIWISTDNHSNSVLYSNFAGVLSDPSIECVSAALSGTNVVWLGSDNQLHTNFGGVIPIGDLSAGYPAISGTSVVWLRTDASNNHEIYMSTYGEAQVTPLPGAVLLGLLGLGTAGIKLRARA
jgi:hypothetical protein